MSIKRVFLIVLDSLGAGEAPDADRFGDVGANTLRSLARSGHLNIKNLISLGLGNIDGLDFLGKTNSPLAIYGKMRERSMGKDTTVGHWEIAGVISPSPLPTYPNGFDKEIISQFEKRTGFGVLCNKPYSGTEVINNYADEHIKTGKLIVYTSADSVFQIAAHEDILPPERLYEVCKCARQILVGDHGVGRVIARPFVGIKGNFKRTANRRDFSIEPPRKTLCDAVLEAGLDSIAIGKIIDIFASRGFSQSTHTHSNAEGMSLTSEFAKKDFCGLCFTNLVDFDTVFGHRRNATGYAEALNEFDSWLGGFMEEMSDDDLLIITADHGCDPSFMKTTDHTREYTPLIAYGKKIKPRNVGIRQSFADIAAEISALLGLDLACDGERIGFIKE